MAKVTLLTHTPMPEQTIAAAAKLCYSAAEIDKIYEGLTPEKTASFVEMLSEIGHESPIEHASFTFGIEGVSRSFLAQVTRHRMASFSVQSQRYVKENMFEYVLPPEIESVPEAREEYIRAMEEDQAHYDSLTAILKEKHKKILFGGRQAGKEANRLAEKKAIEDARFVLPNACNTKMDLHDERPKPDELFHPAVLQPGPSGKSGMWRIRCIGWFTPRRQSYSRTRGRPA